MGTELVENFELGLLNESFFLLSARVVFFVIGEGRSMQNMYDLQLFIRMSTQALNGIMQMLI